jgi:hypothetical protein
MALEVRVLQGKSLVDGKTGSTGLQELVLDGVVIGHCFERETVIHWTVPKKSLPKHVIQQAIWLLQSRNLHNRADHEQQRLRIAR